MTTSKVITLESPNHHQYMDQGLIQMLKAFLQRKPFMKCQQPLKPMK